MSDRKIRQIWQQRKDRQRFSDSESSNSSYHWIERQLGRRGYCHRTWVSRSGTKSKDGTGPGKWKRDSFHHYQRGSDLYVPGSPFIPAISISGLRVCMNGTIKNGLNSNLPFIVPRGYHERLIEAGSVWVYGTTRLCKFERGSLPFCCSNQWRDSLSSNSKTATGGIACGGITED